jgi:hypothetical protein
MGILARVPQLWKYIGVATISLVISVAGVVVAVCERCPSIGGIGGAIGTALAFASLFLRPDYGLGIYKIITEGISPDLPRIDQIEARLDALVNALHTNSNGQVIQNWAIAVASVIGTLVWALGESIARWFLEGHFFACQ